MLGVNMAVQATRNYRSLCKREIILRKTVDVVIGTFCIEGGHHLLQNDRDFDLVAQQLRLQVA